MKTKIKAHRYERNMGSPKALCLFCSQPFRSEPHQQFLKNAGWKVPSSPAPRKTTLQIMTEEMRPWSNYRLIETWNSTQDNLRNPLIVPLIDVLKERGITARRGRLLTQRFISDAKLENLLRLGTANPPQQKPTIQAARVEPKLDVDSLMGKIGNTLLALWIHSQVTPNTVDKFRVRHDKNYAKFIRLPIEQRRKIYHSIFVKFVGRMYGAQVCNLQQTETFKALVRAGDKLIQFRAGQRRGERFIEATPIRWSDLSEV